MSTVEPAGRPEPVVIVARIALPATATHDPQTLTTGVLARLAALYVDGIHPSRVSAVALHPGTDDVLWSAARVGLDGITDDGGWTDAALADDAAEAVDTLTNA